MQVTLDVGLPIGRPILHLSVSGYRESILPEAIVRQVRDSVFYPDEAPIAGPSFEKPGLVRQFVLLDPRETRGL